MVFKVQNGNKYLINKSGKNVIALYVRKRKLYYTRILLEPVCDANNELTRQNAKDVRDHSDVQKSNEYLEHTPFNGRKCVLRKCGGDL